MNDLMRSYSAIAVGVVTAYVLSYPLQAGLNNLAVHICKNNPDKGLVQYKDPVFVGQVKLACINKKYI